MAGFRNSEEAHLGSEEVLVLELGELDPETGEASDPKVLAGKWDNKEGKFTEDPKDLTGEYSKFYDARTGTTGGLFLRNNE
jgi:hypothetical protein